MLRIVRLTFLLLLLAAALCGVTATAASHQITVLHAEGVVNPVLADYIERGINQAETENASAVIIQLDTPGGLDTSMRDIVKSMVNARVPVVVYVSPSGARAASAGVFITIAGHIAAMAPSTAIGAAHPVSIGSEGEETMSETMEEKVVNDAAAYIRGIAEAHGRNMEWAEQAVRESVSATEQEALALNVIDLVADDLNSLIAAIDGRQITLLGGQIVILSTANASINHLEMTAIENFLFAISDPNIAYLLLSIATMGIMVEIFNPGLIFPGVIGAISGLLAFFALGALPVNTAGLLLIVLGIGLFITEIFTPIFGILTAGGVISLVFGSLILFKGGALFEVNIGLIIFIALVLAAFFFFAINRIVKAHRRQATTGREELIGKMTDVRTALEPLGTVFHEGEIWQAELDEGHAEPGEEVVITGAEGLKLFVTKKKKGGN
jgi:membrane-bound serine protease (ClpP class)